MPNRRRLSNRQGTRARYCGLRKNTLDLRRDSTPLNLETPILLIPAVVVLRKEPVGVLAVLATLIAVGGVVALRSAAQGTSLSWRSPLRSVITCSRSPRATNRMKRPSIWSCFAVPRKMIV